MEKPMALDSALAEELIAESEKHPRQVYSGCTARYSRLNTKYTVLRQLIEQGRLGEVYHIHHRSIGRRGRPGIEYNPSAKWFLDRSKSGGGILWDWGGYDLAFHLGLVGDPDLTRVQAFTVKGLDRVESGADVWDVEEHGMAVMTFGNGMTYYWERATNAHAELPHQTVIYGSKGGVTLSYCSWDSPDMLVYGTADEGRGEAVVETLSAPAPFDPGQGDMDAAAEMFVAAVLDGEQLAIAPRRELANMKTLEEIYAAAPLRAL
jgi:predicted dehydrogenase